MNNKKFKSGELVWICIWDEKSKKFLKVCGTMIQYINDDWVEVFASAQIFKRIESDINKIDNMKGFLPFPFTFKNKK